jgi:nitrogen-specific signal transduction histidine kinase
VNRAERSLLSFLDAPVVVGDPEGRAVYVNPAFEARFEVDSEASAGQPLAELFSGGSREAVLRAVAEVCERGESVRVPLRERGAGFSAVISPIVADEARVGVVILLREEMEGVERMIAIHREIADPLDELESTLQVLHEQTGGRRAQRYRADVEDGLRALARLRKWTDELRATLAGRAGAGNKEASFEPAQLVRAVARRLRARAGAAHADLAFLAPAALPRVRGESPKLEAILLRLVQERVALDPAPETLTLSARLVGRAPTGSVLVTLSETFRAGSAPPAVREPPLVREVLAACGGTLHVTTDAHLGRATLLRIPLAEA